VNVDFWLPRIVAGIVAALLLLYLFNLNR